MNIETKRLLLRKPILGDFEEYWSMKNDAIATRYTGGITPYSYADRLKMFREEWVDADQNTELSVVIRESDEYIGYCGFIEQNELLYGLKRSAWQKGYGLEAAQAALHYGFTILQLAHVVSTVNPNNIASERILKGLGMTLAYTFEEPGIGVLHKYRINADDYFLRTEEA